MKIKELLKEFDPNSVHVGQDIGNDFKKGSDAVKNFVNPSKWVGGAAPAEKKFASSVEMRDSLNAAASGRYYEDDIANLKQVLSGVKAGTYKVPNPKFTVQNLTTVINGGRVDKQGSADLAALAKSF